MSKFTSIRESLTPVAGADVSKFQPRQIVETLSRCENLHQQVAGVAATDNALSWEATQLHNEITAQEHRLVEAMTQPARHAAKLQEQHVKALKAMKIVLETALKYKTAAGKGLKEAAAKSAKLKETITRGQGWVSRAQRAESNAKLLERKYQYACEVIDEAESRYKSDTAELGRRVLQLEFKDKITPDILKKLNEASTLRALIGIREGLEGKVPFKKAPDSGEPVEGKSKDKLKDTEDDKDEAGKKEESVVTRLAGVAPIHAVGAPTAETVQAPAATAPAAVVTEPAPAATAPVVTDSKKTDDNPRGLPKLIEVSIIGGGNRAFSINESAACAKRLSEATR